MNKFLEMISAIWLIKLSGSVDPSSVPLMSEDDASSLHSIDSYIAFLRLLIHVGIRCVTQ